MFHRTLVLPFVCACALAVGCDGKDATDAKAPKAAKPGDAKPSADPEKEEPADPHAAANPHAPKGPHAGGPPMMPQKPAGPPRDITPSGETVESTLKEQLTVAAPKEWEAGEVSKGPMSMRAAQWIVPGPGGDAELVVYYQKGGMGTVEQNMARWQGQIQPPEGKTIEEVAKQETKKVGELTVTHLDIPGRFVAPKMPGQEEKHDEADYRMIAAVVEGTEEPFYFKATGPAKTMDLWAEPMAKMFGELKKPAAQ